MADAGDYALLRADVGASTIKLPDEDAAAIFVAVETDYTGNPDAIYAAARVVYLRRVWAESVEDDVDYVQNEESEKLGQRAVNREKLLKYWETKLDAALAAAEEAVTDAQPPPSGTTRLRAVW